MFRFRKNKKDENKEIQESENENKSPQEKKNNIQNINKNDLNKTEKNDHNEDENNKSEKKDKKKIFSFLKKKKEIEDETNQTNEDKSQEDLEEQEFLKNQDNLEKINTIEEKTKRITNTIESINDEESYEVKDYNQKIKKSKEEINKINKELETKKENNHLTKDKETIINDNEKPNKKKGFFSNIFSNFSNIVTKENFDELFFDIEIELLEKNIAIDVVEEIKEKILELLENKKTSNFKKEIKETIESILENIIQEPIKIIKKPKQTPQKILFLGINGVGKTTSLAKFIYKLQENKFSVVVAASDTFRAAAIDQLETLTDKLNVKLIKQNYGADPASVAFDAIEHAKKNNIDYVLIDSAGRLHNNKNLMRELEKIHRVNKIDHVIFVGDCISGNDLIEQAQEFEKIIPIDSIILTKSDTDKALGAIISVSYAIKKPIIYLGTGQEMKDLEEFNKQEFINNLLKKD